MTVMWSLPVRDFPWDETWNGCLFHCLCSDLCFSLGGSKQKWLPLNLEPAKHSSSKGGGGGGAHRDRHREGGGIDHSHGRYERERDRGRWRSERERYHPPPRYSNHLPSEYAEGYGVPPPEGGYGYQGGRGVGGRGGGGRGRNWRYPPPGGQGSYKRMLHVHTYTHARISCTHTFYTHAHTQPQVLLPTPRILPPWPTTIARLPEAQICSFPLTLDPCSTTHPSCLWTKTHYKTTSRNKCKVLHHHYVSIIMTSLHHNNYMSSIHIISHGILRRWLQHCVRDAVSLNYFKFQFHLGGSVKCVPIWLALNQCLTIHDFIRGYWIELYNRMRWFFLSKMPPL